MGGSDIPKLLRSNLSQHKQGLAPDTLPRLFQECIVVASLLNIRCVCVDALCIIQHDTSDLQLEIPWIGQIYHNALLNIASLEATSGKPSCLVQRRNARLTSPFAVSIQRNYLSQDYFVYWARHVWGEDCSALMRRGWVIQERIMSRWSACFGSQIHWECCEATACEAFPARKPSRPGGTCQA